MTPLLEVEDLAVDFLQYERGLRRRTVTALSGMDVVVPAGAVVALVGASGAGKSLLAHAVLGMLPPNAHETGRVLLDGEPVDPAARRRLAGRAVTMLPQSVSFLDPVATVGGQVRRSARLAGAADPRGAAAEALARHGLEPAVARQYPHELSGGMARRVLLAMATLGPARLVLADEPTPGLPADTVRDVLSGFRRLADEGRGVLLITHELAGAVEVADRVVLCREGRTVAELDPADVSTTTDPYARALWQALPANGFRVPAEA